jgi:stage II sporulation protein AA (anti-sigma F factor antagonist)
MPAQPTDEWFTIEQAGEVTVVRLAPRCGRCLEDETIKHIADCLFSLQANEGRRRLVLSLAGVERLDSLLLGKLVALHKRALAAGGTLALCQLNPQLYEVFQTLQLTTFLRIYGTEQEAVARV